MKNIFILSILGALLSSCSLLNKDETDTDTLDSPEIIDVIDTPSDQKTDTLPESNDMKDPDTQETTQDETPVFEEPQEVITPEEEDQIVEDTIQDIEDIFKLLETE